MPVVRLSCEACIPVLMFMFGVYCRHVGDENSLTHIIILFLSRSLAIGVEIIVSIFILTLVARLVCMS